MFFSKKNKNYVELEYNRETLMSHLNDILDRFYVYKQEECMKDVFQVVQIGKNTAILDAAKALTNEERIKYQAKIEVYQELDNAFTSAVNRISHEKKEGKGPTKGSFNVFRRVSNQAGSAI
jgi:hypothetical protein